MSEQCAPEQATPEVLRVKGFRDQKICGTDGEEGAGRRFGALSSYTGGKDRRPPARAAGVGEGVPRVYLKEEGGKTRVDNSGA